MAKTELTTDEIALYDRQIRLWGMDAQIRLQAAKILIINLGGLGTEVVKNLVLGGINSIEILDDSTIMEHDFASQFFLPNDMSIVGQVKLPHVIDKIRDLNHRVTLVTNTDNIDAKLTQHEYFKNFDLVIATELTHQQVLQLNSVTRSLSIPLYVAGLNGMFGYIFTDLIEHLSTSKLAQGNQPRQVGQEISGRKSIVSVEPMADSVEKVTVKDSFVPLQQVFEGSRELDRQLNKRQVKRLTPALPLTIASFSFARPLDPEDILDMKVLREIAEAICDTLNLPSAIITDDYVSKFAQQAFTEFSPVAAVLGGTLAQDVIQFLSKTHSPINNVLILDALKSEMPIFFI